MNNSLQHKQQSTSKDFFLWLGVMVTLYLSSISLVLLLFEYIKILFPDPLDYYVDPYRGAVRFSIASLIVAFPLYIYLTRVVNTGMRSHKEKSELTVRKWIVSLTLFVAAVTLLIDLIALINVFLGGEITSQFILKVVVVLLVIGGVFMYYFYDLKGYWTKHEKKSMIYAKIVSLVVIASVIGGFFIMGSPANQRLLRFDQEKIGALQNIQWEVLNYYQSKGEVPSDLDQLEDSLSYFEIPIDPQTGESYVYGRSGDLAFTLCATFNKESFNDSRAPNIRPKYGFENANWEHGSGEFCFKRDIDPELYPLREGLPQPAFR